MYTDVLDELIKSDAYIDLGPYPEAMYLCLSNLKAVFVEELIEVIAQSPIEQTILFLSKLTCSIENEQNKLNNYVDLFVQENVFDECHDLKGVGELRKRQLKRYMTLLSNEVSCLKNTHFISFDSETRFALKELLCASIWPYLFVPIGQHKDGRLKMITWLPSNDMLEESIVGFNDDSNNYCHTLFPTLSFIAQDQSTLDLYTRLVQKGTNTKLKLGQIQYINFKKLDSKYSIANDLMLKSFNESVFNDIFHFNQSSLSYWFSNKTGDVNSLLHLCSFSNDLFHLIDELFSSNKEINFYNEILNNSIKKSQLRSIASRVQKSLLKTEALIKNQSKRASSRRAVVLSHEFKNLSLEIQGKAKNLTRKLSNVRSLSQLEKYKKESLLVYIASFELNCVAQALNNLSEVKDFKITGENCTEVYLAIIHLVIEKRMLIDDNIILNEQVTVIDSYKVLQRNFNFLGIDLSSIEHLGNDIIIPLIFEELLKKAETIILIFSISEAIRNIRVENDALDVRIELWWCTKNSGTIKLFQKTYECYEPKDYMSTGIRETTELLPPKLISISPTVPVDSYQEHEFLCGATGYSVIRYTKFDIEGYISG